MRRVVEIAVVSVGILSVVSAASPWPTPSARTVYVTVVDRAGRAVPALTPDDFVVKESGKQRTIVSVTPATERMRLALIVADSMVEQPLAIPTATNRDVSEKVPDEVDRRRVRESLTAFVERLSPVADIALFTISRQTEKLADFTSDPRTLVDVIRQLPRNQAPAIVPAESVLAVARQFESEKPARPVVVVVTPGGLWGTDPERLLDQVANSRTQVWAVSITRTMTIGAPYDGFPSADPGDVPRQSGGRHIRVLDLTGLHAAMQQVADDLSSQYVISYTLPDGVKASDRIRVSLKRAGATLLAPSRVPTR
jgi:VWFA-related protein